MKKHETRFLPTYVAGMGMGFFVTDAITHYLSNPSIPIFLFVAIGTVLFSVVIGIIFFLIDKRKI